MDDIQKKFMDTKFSGHHVSAGGYIFHFDKIENKTYVVLIKNKKGEWWIPKGHIESWEDEIGACYREIEEEVGIKKENLKNLGFLENYKFSFIDSNNKENTKEIYIYVLETDSMLPLNTIEGGDDIKQGAWLEIEEARQKIMAYSSEQLEGAISFFKKVKNIK